jgi:hypothetical protein
MMMSLRRARLWLSLSFLLAAACGSTRHSERPTRPPAAAARATATPSPRPGLGFYGADEALRDALSGRLTYVGSGEWPGINRMTACAFRNERVLVVNVYCTLSETPAFRIDVYSPMRGRVRLYAESKGAVSTRTRRDYFTFTAESEPLPGPEARMPLLLLTMTFGELRAYDERRYRAFLPACFGGQELSRKRGGCLGSLAPRAAEWAAQNQAFLDHASDDWYRVVREMRALAARFGREPE